MKNMFKVALLAVVGAMTVVPALAQDNFPDVPENHWAYEALENLKREGILVGYPDGRYRGPRFMTRYEFAVALNAAYKKMMSMHSGLADQIEEMKGMVGKGSDGDLKSQLDELKKQLASMKNWGDEIASIKKMAGTFEKELASLGVDVEAMKKDLEAMKGGKAVGLPVDISGEANFIVYAGNSKDGLKHMTKDGHIVGQAATGGASVGLTKDTNIYHDLSLSLKGNNSSGPKWNAKLVFGNVLGAVGNQSQRAAGTFSDNVSGDVHIQDLAVTFDDSLLGLGFSAVVGRIPVKVSPYMFQKINVLPYSDMSDYNDGCYRMDGAALNFGFGDNTKLTILAGKNSNRNTMNGVDLNPIAFGAGKVDGTLGAVADVKVSDMISGKVAYLFHDTETAGSPNRLNVYGVDGTIKLAGFAINGGYSESQFSNNTTNVGQRGKAAYANTNYKVSDTIGLGVEYRRVNPNYAAVGSWRRIGTAWSPKNIETFTGMLDVKLTDSLALSYMGEFGEVNYNGPATDVTSHVAKLKYKLNDNWKIMLGYEDVKVDYATAVTQKWTTVGFAYNLGTNAMLDFAYEFGDVKNPVAWGVGTAGTYKGGFLSSQLRIKF